MKQVFAKNTPNTMCKNSPLGAFKQYTMNEPGEAGLLNPKPVAW